MKKLPFIFLLCYCIGISVLSGQSRKKMTTDSLRIKREVSVNVTSVLNEIFTLKDSAGIAPFIFAYNEYFSGNYFIRSGVGFILKNKTIQSEGFADKIIHHNRNFNLRLGIGKRHNAGKKYMIDYGIDLVTNVTANNQTSDSGFDLIESISQQYYFGGGGFIAFRYLINKRLSIRSETAFYIVGGRSETATLYKNFPALNDANKIETFLKSVYYLPTNVYMLYSF